MSKKFYLTTAIPYVNANPHIGFALELLQTDVISRYHQQKGDDTFFLTGTDENALKNVQAAEHAGVPTKEFVDEHSQKFVELTKVLNLSNNDFIRTTEEKHVTGSQKLWQACKPDDIYKKNYKGLYCIGCEQFYNEDELDDGKCPEHHTVPEEVAEENYFFKLSNYQKQLEELIESDTYQVVPETRKNEVLSFIRMGLQDFSISRSKARAKNWGVPVPDDDSQVMYVWFDALSNYLTGIGYGSDDAKEKSKFKKYWPADLHVIGKGIIRFHAIYWPAMLMSAGIPLPKKLFVHGYINIKGAKMSKSKGTVVDPFALVEKYRVEPVRYYLLRYMHPVQDSNFSESALKQAYNSDLANGLGNLVNRVASLIEQNDVSIQVVSPDKGKISQDKPILDFDDLMKGFVFDQALKFIWEQISSLDIYISQQKPWEMAKKTDQVQELRNCLATAANDLLEIGQLLSPFMPDTSDKIRKIFTAKNITVPKQALFPRLD